MGGWVDESSPPGWVGGPPIGFQVSLQGPGSAESWAPSQETQIAFQATPKLSSLYGRCTVRPPPTPDTHRHTHTPNSSVEGIR